MLCANFSTILVLLLEYNNKTLPRDPDHLIIRTPAKPIKQNQNILTDKRLCTARIQTLTFGSFSLKNISSHPGKSFSIYIKWRYQNHEKMCFYCVIKNVIPFGVLD